MTMFSARTISLLLERLSPAAREAFVELAATQFFVSDEILGTAIVAQERPSPIFKDFVPGEEG